MTRTSARAFVIAFALIALSHEARTQQPSPAIRGRVVAADNDRPLRRALISQAPSDTARPVLTDDDGRFEMAIAKATTSMTVSKAGYATMRIDVRPPVDRDLEVRLSKGAAISGKVVDESGVACIEVQVIAQRADATGNASMLQTETDDLGEYRIGGLSAGRYAVSVRPGTSGINQNDGAIMEALVSKCVPIDVDLPQLMSSSLATRSVDVGVGDDKSGVDLVVNAPRVDTRLRPAPQAFPTGLAENARGRIEGRVTAAGGEPMAGALVRAVRFISVRGTQAVAGTVVNATTDVAGRFSMRSLQDGEYRVEARKAAHVDALERVLADSHPGHAVRIADGSAENVEIELVRGGAMTGTILDSAGDPVQGVRVSALQLRRDNGRVVATKAGWGRTTDDRGRYRVFGLPTGSYLLVASSNALASGSDRAQRVGFADVYYPGTAGVESAQPLQVRVGSELTGIDLTLISSFAARVSGVVLDTSGQPLAGRVQRVQLATSRRSGTIATLSLSTTVESDGSFELRDVPPGEYVLQGSTEGGFGKAGEFGAEYLAVVDRDPAPVTIRTSPGATLEGRFVADAGAIPPMRALSIHATTIDIDRGPREGRGPSGLAVHEDGRFYLTGLHGEVRFTLQDPPAGWYLKALTIAGIDVADGTFDFGHSERTVGDAEIVLSPSGATIAGVVTDRGGARASGFVAVAFATDRQWWFNGSRHVKQRRGANGSFEIESLPPGEYWVAAVDRLDLGDSQIGDVLETLVTSATRMTVREGQTVSTNLRLVRREQ